jgi:hypothetical protein
MEVNKNGTRYYFQKKINEPDNLFYIKCWAFSKLHSKDLDFNTALKLSELYSHKNYYNCSYSPEVEKKIEEFF